ncbi:MAG TPA: sensor histidine kinase [Methylibium sp.]|nr:sensor histidine kinase [Methylibium sp.]
MRRPSWDCCRSGWPALLWAFALALCVAGARAGGGVIELDRAEFVRSEAAQPPDDSAAWQAQRLPDYWPATRPGEHGHAWYRLHVELPRQPQRQQALLVAWLRSAGTVYVNGTPVGQSGDVGAPDPKARPQLFEFQPQLLAPGRNVVHVRLWVADGFPQGRLWPLRLADKALLLPMLDRQTFLHVTVAQLAAVFSATVGVYMLLIWLQRRHEPMFGYFGVASLLSAAWIAIAWGSDFGLPEPLLILVGVLGNNMPVTLLFVFALRYAGWRWPRVEAALWLVVTVAVLNELADFALGHQLPVPMLWTVPACAGVLLTLAIAWRSRGVESALLCLGFVYMNVAFSYSVLVPATDHAAILATHLVPLQLVIGWILLRRFVRSLVASESMSSELERRVAEKHAELERNYAHLQQVERHSAAAEERSRILSDMHDGIGAQLISTLNLVEHGDVSSRDVATALRECIDDLRLAIDSLEPTDDELLPVLGNLRYRIEPRLKASGITLDWQVGDVPRLPCLTPQNVLHVLRIMQEAFTNVLKHARATRIRVSTSTEGRRLSIDIADDGAGFGADAALARGHGLSSMRSRAQRIGGELQVTPSASGTTLSLRLPID